jgi:hypothetical protein
MGYSVAIIRTAAGRRQRFSAEEIEAAAARLPGWRYDPAAQTLERQAGSDEAGFWLDVGPLELEAKEPTEAQIGLMIELSRSLSARVRGDDLETYRTPTETYAHTDDDQLRRATALPVAGRRSATTAQRVADYIKIGALLLLAINFLAYVLHGWLAGTP